jgi:hypothetical protein
MKKFLLLISLLLTVGISESQHISTELSVGNHGLMYQHMISKKLEKSSRFGLMQIAGFQSWYNSGYGESSINNEVMNQALLSFDFKRPVTIFAGIFYTNSAGLRGTTSVQLVRKGNNWLLVLSPRVDIMRKGSQELVALWEYWPKLNNHVKLYSRTQVMLNGGPTHFNRGYQRFRLGVDFKSTQIGVSQNFEEYGASGILKLNTGVFIRKQFL